MHPLDAGTGHGPGKGRPELRRIAAVDDDADILAMLDLALSKLGGYEVLGCSSGQELVDRIGGFDPDLVILDVMMPEMDGVECLHRLRQEGYRTPVIFLTAKGRRSRSDLQLQDCMAVLSKPFGPATLVEQIQSAWSAAYRPAEED